MRVATYYCAADIIATSVVAGCLVVPLAKPAAADFRLCNNTQSRVGVAIGYKDADGWTTEGWWNLSSRTCENILKGNLVARYYYVYAIDYEHGGQVDGASLYVHARQGVHHSRHHRLSGTRL